MQRSKPVTARRARSFPCFAKRWGVLRLPISAQPEEGSGLEICGAECRNFWRAAVFLGRNRGENIMNAIQKATFAASALAITLVGAALVTAPMAFARPVPVVAH